MTNTVTMHVGDVRTVLELLAELGVTVDLGVTSPPFLALRSYLPADHPDKWREIGSEPTPAAFLDTLYGLTEQVGALLPEWGSFCVELGDTMSGSGGAGGDYNPDGLREGQQKFSGSAKKRAENGMGDDYRPSRSGRDGAAWPLPKSMCLLPHAYTMGLAYGRNPLTGTPSPAGQWRIRNVICWARPNPPVGSLGKRNPHARTGDQKFRPATSYITVACRGTARYFDLDAVRTDLADSPGNRYPRKPTAKDSAAAELGHVHTIPAVMTSNPAGAPPLDWHTDDLDGDWLWKLATAPYKGSHYATFPLTLPRRLIAAMCPARVCGVCGWPSERITETTAEYAAARSAVRDDADSYSGREHLSHKGGGIGFGGGASSTISNGKVTATPITLGWTDCGHDAWRTGIVLDPFGGSGTTAVAAALEHRDAVLIDIDARNVDLVRRRLTEAVRIVDETRDGNTITWTVEAALPAQREQVTGQTSIFDELAS